MCSSDLGEVVSGARRLEQVGEARDVRREIAPIHLTDRHPAGCAPSHHAVVVEHGHPVGGEPDIALEPRRPEPEGEGEGLEGVLRRMRTGSAVPEDHGLVEEGGDALLHPLDATERTASPPVGL